MIPKEIQEIVNDWVGQYISNAELLVKIRELADQHNVDRNELREFMESVMRARGLSDRQVSRSIPVEFKDPIKVKARQGKTRQLSDTKMSSESSIKTTDSLKELGNIVGDAAKKIAEQVQPEPPVDNDPTPEHPLPADAPEEDDTGQWQKQKEPETSVVFIDVPKFMGHFFAANQNKIGAYLYVKDLVVYKVEAANVHKMEVKAK